jgi:hypothetical protein
MRKVLGIIGSFCLLGPLGPILYLALKATDKKKQRE